MLRATLLVSLIATLPLTAQLRTQVFDPSPATTIKFVRTAPGGDLIIAGTTMNPVLPLANPYQSRFASSGFWRTRDGGRTWATGQRPSGNNLILVADPVNPTTIYAFGTRGLYRSTDARETWQILTATVLSDFVIHPAKPSTLYAIANGILKSTDSGITWAGLTFPGSYPGALFIDPTAPDTIWATTYFNGDYKSQDSGTTWTQVSLPGTNRGFSVQFDPKTPGLVYAYAQSTDDATTGNGWRSRDNGSTWTPFNLPHTSGFVLDTLRPGVLYAAGKSALYRSIDAGENFTVINRTGCCSVQIIQGSPPTLIYGSLDISYDGGTSWSNIYMKTPFFTAPSSFVNSPATPGVAYTITPASNDVFLARLDATGEQIRFSTYLGGSDAEDVTALAIDDAGSVYIGGGTSSLDFPTTPGAASSGGSRGYIAKFDSVGHLMWSATTQTAITGMALGSSELVLLSGYSVIGFSLDGTHGSPIASLGNWYIRPDRIAIAHDGSIVVAGNTAVDRFGYGPMLLSWIAPNGTLLAQSRLPDYAVGAVIALTIDRAGNAVLLGTTTSRAFPVSAGSLLPTSTSPACPYIPPIPTSFSYPTPSMFLTRLSPAGEIGASTTLGGQCAAPMDMVLAANDDVIFTGRATSPDFPLVDALELGPSPHSYVGFVARISADASTLRFSSFASSDRPAVTVSSTEQIILGSGNTLEFLTMPPPGSIIVTGIGNAFNQFNSAVAPGEIIFLDVAGLDSIASVDLSLTGPPAPELSNLRVYFGDTQAELMSVSPTRIYCRVPVNVAQPAADVRVEQLGRAGIPIRVKIVASDPGLLSLDGSGRGQAHALNEDGSLNTPMNPARAGSAIRLYFTGLDPAEEWVRVGNSPVPILSGGPVPGFFPGLFETVVQLGSTPGDQTVQIQYSPQLTISIR